MSTNAPKGRLCEPLAGVWETGLFMALFHRERAASLARLAAACDAIFAPHIKEKQNI